MKHIKLFEQFFNENVATGVEITMYNLAKNDIIAIEELGAEVHKEDSMSTADDEIFSVMIPTKEVGKSVLDWLKAAEKDVPVTDLKELFPELFDFIGESKIFESEKFTKDNAREKCPKNLLKKIYDKDDNVLFGSRMVKGKVAYNYVPGELMNTGNDFIIGSEISYDGKGNANLPAGSIIKDFSELPKLFPDNKFSDDSEDDDNSFPG
jgi:hypothetical protein